MRPRPFAFVRVGNRWINMALVTDVEDRGETLVVYFATDQARRVEPDGAPVDVARRIVFSDPEEVLELRKWLSFSDEN